MRVLVVICVVLCAVTAALSPAPVLAADDTVTVIEWYDGDTVVTDIGTVRLVGMNTPERGECGYRAANKLAKKLAPAGSTITLVNPASVVDEDAYDRLLRYVVVDGVDVGLKQIKAGSVAKYDSTDGYDPHPKQRKYRAQDIKHRDYCANHDLASYPPASETTCPAKAPIKGNQGDDDWIYHVKGQQGYAATHPEECFASGDGAKKHGYRAALA